MFHICDGGRKISFLCPNGTVFRQSHLICDWWFKVDCTESEGLYESSAEQLAIDQEAVRQRAASLAPTTPRTDSAYTRIIGSTERRAGGAAQPTAPTSFSSRAPPSAPSASGGGGSGSRSGNRGGDFLSTSSSGSLYDALNSNSNFHTTAPAADDRSGRTFHGQTAPGTDASFTFSGNRNFLQKQQQLSNRYSNLQTFVTGPGASGGEPVFGSRNRVTPSAPSAPSSTAGPSGHSTSGPTVTASPAAPSPRGRGVQTQFRFNKNQDQDDSPRQRPVSMKETFTTAESNGPRTAYREEPNYPPGVNPYLKVTSTPQLQPKKKGQQQQYTTRQSSISSQFSTRPTSSTSSYTTRPSTTTAQYSSRFTSSQYSSRPSTPQYASKPPTTSTTEQPARERERQQPAETASFASGPSGPTGRGSSRFSFGIGRPLETQYVESPSFESRVVSEPPVQFQFSTSTAAPNIYRLQANSKTYAEIKRQRTQDSFDGIGLGSTTEGPPSTIGPTAPTPFYRKYQNALRLHTATPDGAASPTPNFSTTKYVELQRSRTVSYSSAPSTTSAPAITAPQQQQPTRETPREPPTTRYITLARIVPKPPRSQPGTTTTITSTTSTTQASTEETTMATTFEEVGTTVSGPQSLRTLELAAPSPVSEDGGAGGARNTSSVPASGPASGPASLQSLALYFAEPEDLDTTAVTDLPTTTLPTEDIPKGIGQDAAKITISDVLLLPHTNGANFTDFTANGQDSEPERLDTSLTQLTKDSYSALFTETDTPTMATPAYEPPTTTPDSLLDSKFDINLNPGNDLRGEQSRGIIEPVVELSNSIQASKDLNIADNADLRELAQVFTRALSAYLEDPESFRKVLAEVRPTEPPPSLATDDLEKETEATTPTVETSTLPSTLPTSSSPPPASPSTSSPVQTRPSAQVSSTDASAATTLAEEASVTKESDEVLEYSDVNKGTGNAHKNKLFGVTPTPYLPILFAATTLSDADSAPTTTQLPQPLASDFPAIDLEAPLQRLESLLDSQSRYYSVLSGREAPPTVPPDSANYTSIAADVNSLIAILSALNESWTGPPSGPSGPSAPSAASADDATYFPTAGGVQDVGLPRYGGFQNNSKYSPYGAEVLRARGATPPATTTLVPDPMTTTESTPSSAPSKLHEIPKENLEKIDNALGSFAPEDLNHLAVLLAVSTENSSVPASLAGASAPSAPSASGSNAVDPVLVAAGSQSYVARDNKVVSSTAKPTSRPTPKPAPKPTLKPSAKATAKPTTPRATTPKASVAKATPKPVSKSLPKQATTARPLRPASTAAPKAAAAVPSSPTKKPKYAGPIFVTPTHTPAASSTVAVRTSAPPSSTTTTSTTPRPTTTPFPTTQELRFRGAKYLTTPETLTSKPLTTRAPAAVPVTVAQAKAMLTGKPTAPPTAPPSASRLLEQSLDTSRTRYRLNLRSGKSTPFDLSKQQSNRLPPEDTLNAHKPLNPLAINYELTTAPTTRSQSAVRATVSTFVASASTTASSITTYHPRQQSPTAGSQPPPTAPPEDSQSSTWVLPANPTHDPTSTPDPSIPKPRSLVNMSVTVSASTGGASTNRQVNMPMTQTMVATAEAMFGHLNASMADMFMTMLKEAETNMTIRRLVLLLVNNNINDQTSSGSSAQEVRDQLLEALLNNPQAAAGTGQPAPPSTTPVATTTTTTSTTTSTTTATSLSFNQKRKISRLAGRTVNKTTKSSSSGSGGSYPSSLSPAAILTSRLKERPTTPTTSTTTRRPLTTLSTAATTYAAFVTDPVFSTVLPQFSSKKPSSSEELALASSDSRAVELLRSLYSLAAQWG